MTVTAPVVDALLVHLDDLARDFDHEATHYDLLDDAEPINRASASLRLIRTGLREGTFDFVEGYAWLRAGRAVLKATMYARLNGVPFAEAVQAVSA